MKYTVHSKEEIKTDSYTLQPLPPRLRNRAFINALEVLCVPFLNCILSRGNYFPVFGIYYSFALLYNFRRYILNISKQHCLLLYIFKLYIH